MSKEKIQLTIETGLLNYFEALGDQDPSNIYEMILHTIEKPLLEVSMKRANGNQSQAAAILGINRNTLRKKLLQHGLS